MLAYLLVFGSSKGWPNTFLKDLPKYYAYYPPFYLMVFGKGNLERPTVWYFSFNFGLFSLHFSAKLPKVLQFQISLSSFGLIHVI